MIINSNEIIDDDNDTLPLLVDDVTSDGKVAYEEDDINNIKYYNDTEIFHIIRNIKKKKKNKNNKNYIKKIYILIYIFMFIDLIIISTPRIILIWYWIVHNIGPWYIPLPLVIEGMVECIAILFLIQSEEILKPIARNQKEFQQILKEENNKLKEYSDYKKTRKQYRNKMVWKKKPTKRKAFWWIIISLFISILFDIFIILSIYLYNEKVTRDADGIHIVEDWEKFHTWLNTIIIIYIISDIFKIIIILLSSLYIKFIYNFIYQYNKDKKVIMKYIRKDRKIQAKRRELKEKLYEYSRKVDDIEKKRNRLYGGKWENNNNNSKNNNNNNLINFNKNNNKKKESKIEIEMINISNKLESNELQPLPLPPKPSTELHEDFSYEFKELLRYIILIILIFFFLIFFISFRSLMHTQWTSDSRLLKWHKYQDDNYDKLCDSLDLSSCASPWPSSFYLKKNKDTNNIHINIKGESLLLSKNDKVIDSTILSDFNGFPTLLPISFSIPLENNYNIDKNEYNNIWNNFYNHFPYKDNIKQSLNIDKSSTLIIPFNLSLPLHPHFIQTINDNSLPSFFTKHSRIKYEPFLMMPIKPLLYNTWYIVVVQEPIQSKYINSTYISKTEGYKNIFEECYGTQSAKIITKSKKPYKSIQLEDTLNHNDRNKRFCDIIFPFLNDYGVDLDRTLLVFDFLTGTENNIMKTMNLIKNQSNEFLNDNLNNYYNNNYYEELFQENDKCKLINNNNNNNNNINQKYDGNGLIIWSKYKAPWVLESKTIDAPSERFIRLPRHQNNQINEKKLIHDKNKKWNLKNFNMVSYIPCSLLYNTDQNGYNILPKGILLYSHGFLEDRSHSITKTMKKLAEDGQFIIISTDWRGISRNDIPVLLRSFIQQPNDFITITDQLYQSYLSMNILLNIYKPQILPIYLNNRNNNLNNYQFNDNILNNIPIIYYGNSFGGIIGSGFIKFSSNIINRVILGVTGTPFTFVLPHSSIFHELEDLLELNLKGGDDARILFSLMQTLFTPFELHNIDNINLNNNENNKQILLQSILNDPMVRNEATDILARTLNISLINPPIEDIFQLKTSKDIINSYESILTEYQFNEPKDLNKLHKCVRENEIALKQVLNFIVNGTISNYCPNNDKCIIDEKCDYDIY